VEWWDVPLLEGQQPAYNAEPTDLKITIYIHHPVELLPVGEAPPPGPMPLMLTDKEKKKIRHMRKLEKEKERQDLMRFGLITENDNRATLKNFVAVMGTDAFTAPSNAEAAVKKQMAERLAKHLQHNESRRKGAEQRAEKLRKKLKENVESEINVAVFRAGDFTDARRRFKVDINAQQLSLSGIVVLWGDCNVVVVEGAAKPVKKFARLMTHRIQWSNPTEGEKAEGEESGGEEEEESAEKPKSSSKGCVLVWQGTVAKRFFKEGFRFEACRSESMARKIFEDKKVAHYWDMCKNYVDPAST